LNKPRLIILAGPNGAGKSTFADSGDLQFLRDYNVSSFDYDLEFKKLYDKFRDIMTLQIEENLDNATKQLFEDLAKQALTNKTHFSFQTNYDKEYTEKWRLMFSEAGFETELYFLYVDSINLCVQRVAKRVSEGGHNVPLSEITTRYIAGLQNFDSSFNRFDRVIMIDTSLEQNILLLEIENSEINYIHKNLESILSVNKLSKLSNWIINR